MFATEPLPEDSPLFALPNVFMSPHVSGNFPAYTHAVIDGFLRNLRRYVAGKPGKRGGQTPGILIETLNH